MSRLIDWNGLSRFLYNCKQIFSRKPSYNENKTLEEDSSVFAFKMTDGHVYEVIVQLDNGMYGTQIITVVCNSDDIVTASANNLKFYQKARLGTKAGASSQIPDGTSVLYFTDEVGFASGDYTGASINISVKDITTGETVISEYFPSGTTIDVDGSCDISCLEEDVASILNTI